MLWQRPGPSDASVKRPFCPVPISELRGVFVLLFRILKWPFQPFEFWIMSRNSNNHLTKSGPLLRINQNEVADKARSAARLLGIFEFFRFFGICLRWNRYVIFMAVIFAEICYATGYAALHSIPGMEARRWPQRFPEPWPYAHGN